MIQEETKYRVKCDDCLAELAAGINTAEEAMTLALKRGRWVFDPVFGREILICLKCNARRTLQSEMTEMRRRHGHSIA